MKPPNVEMAEFKEHDNRAKAKALAEYITGEELRRYVARKVHKYVGTDMTVFDGAAGSGQLQQYLTMKQMTAVEIQADSCHALQSNYPNATVYNQSFFLWEGQVACDCVIMNPPFSIRYKNLTPDEQEQITTCYPWKRSGVVDDIFVLKGLKQSTRWGFFILFPGVGYRKAEQRFRETIGNSIVELNRVCNAFEDTAIEVIFIVVDKDKTDAKAHRELYDCKSKSILNRDEWEISPELWESILPPLEEKEKIDPLKVELEAQEAVKRKLRAELSFSKMVALYEHTEAEYNAFCRALSEIALSQMI